jgi:hypothetical protein
MKDSYGISYLGFNLLTGLLEIPLDERWLKGEEYAFLLRHYKTYNKLLGFTVNDKSQDATVYETPRSKFKYNEINIDGMVYFMKGMHLREFGFPRLKDDINQQRTEKPYKWKKTNFVTDLPKHQPTARYLVAKTTNRKDSHFFMHVSILHRGNSLIIFNNLEYDPNYKVPSELK